MKYKSAFHYGSRSFAKNAATADHRSRQEEAAPRLTQARPGGFELLRELPAPLREEFIQTFDSIFLSRLGRWLPALAGGIFEPGGLAAGAFEAPGA